MPWIKYNCFCSMRGVTSSSFLNTYAITLSILSETENRLSILSAAASAFLYAVSVSFSRFSMSFRSIYTGDVNAAFTTSEYSLEGICPSRYLGIVTSPNPIARDRGAFPILYIFISLSMSSIDTSPSAALYCSSIS